MMRQLAQLSFLLLPVGTLAVGCGGSAFSALVEPTVEAGAEGASAQGDAGLHDGAAGSDGPTVGPDAAVPATGAGPGGDTTTLPCGPSPCAIPGEVCCVTGSGGANAPAYACVTGTCGGAGGAGNGNVVTLGCTDTANCGAGSVCCIDQRSNGGLVSECSMGAAACMYNAAQLCDPAAAPGASGCPATGPNMVCTSDKIASWGLTPPFATCGGIGN